MKRFRTHLATLCLTLFVFLTTSARADNMHGLREQMDSVEISLLTCSPGTEVWSLYGHTAIRVFDPVHQQDIAVNYGMFNFRQSNFILRFVFGLTDYEMGIVPFQMFMMEYASKGRGVVQQRLQLSADEKAAIIQAIAENYEPANRVYRYNFFYDNCTTRARDILVSHLDGKTGYQVNPEIKTSYREMIHQMNGQHRWARFGNDLLLGIKADAPTDYAQQQFLPDRLRRAFDSAQVVEVKGHKHRLVDTTSVVLDPNAANVPDTHDLWSTVTPFHCFMLLSAIVILCTIIEDKRRKTFWLLDVILLTLDGLAGLVLLSMIFSQHPTVSVNLQILLLNPLSIIFVYPVASKAVKGRFHFYWGLLGLCILLFLVGGFFQHYAEGMYILALTLLIRVYTNYSITRKIRKAS